MLIGVVLVENSTHCVHHLECCVVVVSFTFDRRFGPLFEVNFGVVSVAEQCSFAATFWNVFLAGLDSKRACCFVHVLQLSHFVLDMN